MVVFDFDMLCSAVAMQTQGKWNNVGGGGEEEGRGLGSGEAGGFSGCGKVSSSWIASRTAPRLSIRLLSMLQIREEYEESGIRFFFVQGSFHLVLVFCALANTIAFGVTWRHYFLYLAVSFTLSVGAYMGFFRMQMGKKFNIKEARTLEMINVQDVTWHGRGDAICIASYGNGSKASVELNLRPFHLSSMETKGSVGG